jgi:hypothetical protein
MVSVLMDLEAKNLSATNANGRIADVDQFFTAHLDNVHHVFFFFFGSTKSFIHIYALFFRHKIFTGKSFSYFLVLIRPKIMVKLKTFSVDQ